MTAVQPEPDLEIGKPETAAAGLPAVAVSLGMAVSQMGPVRTARTLLRLNQVDGFDCMSCAWPDPDPEHRHTAEFCENGAKAVAWEGDTRRIGPDFFAAHYLADLETRSEYWMGQQGRLTEPVVRRAGGTHYEPITWEAAFALVAEHLNGLDSPDEALFYTSGRASNEAAFVYQLFARAYGTNNLPDCSNMCHEATSVGLADTIGIGKGSVSLDDVHEADLIVISGQNPGTNHPRMLSALEIAKHNGATIVAINPLREAGLLQFNNPQKPSGIVGRGTELADLYLQVRSDGDLALWQALGHLLLARGVADEAFIAEHTVGFDAYAAHLAEIDRAEVLAATGLEWERIEELADLFARSSKIVNCWAMGITQHRNAVATIKEFVNVALLQGMIGKLGAGLCPVRGHSNVQGDRTMGIWERSPDSFLDALRDEFGFEPPREHGLDAVKSVRALRDGRASVFVGLGGNFASAMSDTGVTEAALRGAALTVQISTKLNRSHVACGETALILPALGRTEKDLSGGTEQRITVEDSMSSVHASRGRMTPAGPELRSEVGILCGIASATLGDRHGIPWAAFAADYDEIRHRIARVVPGCEGYAEKIRERGGFVLPHPPRDSRTFPTEAGKAVFSVSPLAAVQVPPGRLVLQTMRSHDQFNTTIYGLDDRYRGIHHGRRVVFVSAADLAELGFADGEVVDLVGEWSDGVERRAPGFRLVEYSTPKGCAAAYYPETNALIPLDSVALEAGTPTSKWVVIRLER
ncbi:FdhF/YdeP family oxidoreductase [Pseudonocardia sp. KRD-184]|uniref:FdhF/YdeP family oxidoreductase n=1 Tax=Pseudonocardia oceani TaxID=2792013 RepID=A0ABS6UAK1_9PSEU|nr:FdhF/YdeP family oxidoreductase [Pseudonocardia oceani]MBW0089918.1 FdhF/YdeP family oxidoreductase [Pseudonocardia oceani]MBW0094766.1 FdhF/YdeP family oxidoreductase [Pseudonocardia oceani]MBW0109717.1 FdhF/YdeP family oxidoreductase [Pseudonocardia oceani]MBW0120274.1 FdhF/YdeP family oxidoreductase [Pseudonocardia oceani]MBW0128998.1 FdhF/YdeP family oxidoreductase [Pseudonocardia oceani]